MLYNLTTTFPSCIAASSHITSCKIWNYVEKYLNPVNRVSELQHIRCVCDELWRKTLKVVKKCVPSK